MTKRLIALAVAMMTLFLACPALAATPDYTTTADFLAAMDEVDIKYTFAGTDSDKDEVVTVENTTDEYGDVTFRFYFSEDQDDVSMRVWNVIDFEEADRVKVLEACNQANYDYRFVTFYVDDNDNSVTLSYDAYLPARASGDICVSVLQTAHSILKLVYPTLAEFAR